MQLALEDGGKRYEMRTQIKLKPKKKRTYETCMDNIKADLQTRFRAV
jgi:hypothetical protein